MNSVQEAVMAIRLGVVRGITFGHYGPPENVLPQVKGMNLDVLRVYLYWSQIEPEPGRFDWSVVDALLDQLDGEVEAWVTVSSASLWGTKRKTDFLPPSPAKDLDRFGAFVRELVAHCQGKIAYWQFDNEPTVPILWAGTPQEYVAQLKVFAAAVRETDPRAKVVLGGMPPGAHTDDRAAWQHILANSGDDFDILDIHLYGDPYEIPAAIASARSMMTQAGYEKPVVAGEYNGPVSFEFPEAAFAVLGPVIQVAGGGTIGRISDDWSANTGDAGAEPPEQKLLADLYARVAELPPELRMFVPDAPAEDEERRHRWNSRDIVVRNLLAFANDVEFTLCWNLGPETPNIPRTLYSVMGFMFDKFKLMDYRDGVLDQHYPSGEALQLTAGILRGASKVRQHEVPGRPDLFVFEIERPDAPPVIAAWVRRPGLTGETEPPVDFDWPWAAPQAHAIDAYGQAQQPKLEGGRVHLALTIVPVFIKPAG
jgi:hypothetical protein